MRRLEGKLAVVTGAANGIGRASALRFASEGANLAIMDLEAGGLEKVAEEARAVGAKVLAIAGDCTKEEFLAPSFRRIYDEFGFVDVLMNNVGQSARERASEFYKSEPEVWRFVIDITLFSTLTASPAESPLRTRMLVGSATSRLRRSPPACTVTLPPPSAPTPCWKRP
jgi:acetoacetyl-CoA reductase/3-oxoacyl-[acyl-carrier protein] reductase